jgi:hypothetical protein
MKFEYFWNNETGTKTPNALGNRRDAGPIGGASVLTAGLGVGYCHEHGKHRCQVCIDELVAIGIQGDKDRIKVLENALRISTNGLRHCSRWNISEETEKAIMTQVIANEALLTANGTELRG